MSDFIQIVKGKIDPTLLSVYCIVKNEIFYLKAFLDHYRRLGIRQFLFLDDRSTDGTFEFLESQADCILARSPLRYGDRVNGRRAVHIWKSEIPRRFMLGQWAICVDADEFIFVPPAFSTFKEFTLECERRDITSVTAIMVDLYPETIHDIQSGRTPQTRDEMFTDYPWFDSGPYFEAKEEMSQPVFIRGGARERLLRKFDISKRAMNKSGWKLVRHLLKSTFSAKQYIKPASVTKVPLVKWTLDREYMNSHVLNEDFGWDILLPIAHFKFTSDLQDKIQSATQTSAYSDSSRAYHEYADLLMRMKSVDPSFLSEHSVRFKSVEDFERANLMHFE